ncbi:MAG: hypothetical protein KC777_14035 [Cyanobacteria bacterium HKST-UBA02]|nr:hypothetical protein [Cyanobacteria bacterium HKST-UBA02]
MFSRKDIADYINTHFEPVWVSVRPVPKVEIDFGNGRKVTRTLHGNIATYICTSKGMVFDILPGIYDPAQYRAQLEAIATALAQTGGQQEAMFAYHRRQLRKTHEPAPVTVPVGFTGIYGELLADSRINESSRRDQIHRILQARPVTPESIKIELYRDILHADITDPYLGVDKEISYSF